MSNKTFRIEFDFEEKGSLGGIYKKSWVEESFDVEREGNPKLSIAHTKNYIGTSIGRKTIYYFISIIVLVFALILGRTIQLQIFNGNYYRELAEGNRVRLLPIPAQRGVIYDRNNKELLRNIPGFSLAIIPQDLPRKKEDRLEIVKKLSELSGVDQEEIESLLKKYGAYGYQSLIVKDNLDYNTALKLYIENANLPGIEIVSGSKRGYYLTSSTESMPSLSHLIGYVGKLNDDELESNKTKGYLPSDLIGKTGLEKAYESSLRGTYGRKKIEVNAVGKEQSVLAMEPPAPGNNLVLTLDLSAQKKLEELVKETAENTGKKRISAIAMNPEDGGIIAMVSWPAFDNNKFVGGIDKESYNAYLNDPDRPLFNRTIGGIYPPGSTVKLVVAAAALQEKIVSKTTSFLSLGGIEVGGKFFKDWKVGGHGYTNVTKAIAWSVNTFFYYAGGGYEKFVGLGVDRINKYMASFGIGSKTNIDMPGENTGFLPSREWKKEAKNEIWYVGDTYNISIGQGDLLVTPLQAAVWTAAVANGGNIVTPHLGDKIVDPVTKKDTPLKYEMTKNSLVSDYTLQVVREGMRECVAYGSCGMLRSLSFPTAGKTGTAQWSKNQPTHAWFTSFAPYQKPKIVMTVLVENGGEGSVIAQPIAYRFLDWWGKNYLNQ